MSNSFFIGCPNPEGVPGSHRLNIYEWGDKKNKPLICVHGLTRNARDFDFICQELKSDHHILCPDIAGRGKSDWLPSHQLYNYVTYVTDMLHMMQQLGISGAHWIGTSMGGLIGMLVAANVPGAIEKLVLNDIGALVPGAGLQRIGGYVGNEVIFNTRQDAENYFSKICRPWGINNPEHIKHITEHSIVPTEKGFRLAYDLGIGKAFRDDSGGMKKIDDINLWEIWEKISCPVLLLHGEQSDILTTSVADQMAKKKGVTLVRFPEIGHAPALMDDGQIKIIANWLRTAHA